VTAEEFEAVYARTMPALRAYLVRAGGDAALADDLLQETYYKFLGMDPAKRAAAPEKPLLFRIAMHGLYDHFRRRRREALYARAADAAPAASSTEPNEDVARLFRNLSPREQSLLWLAYVEGMSHVEIAAALTLRPASIRVLLHRARGAFARLLGSRGLGPR
jgi:RNA polymerase sigma-70 factor (ECF subfamily)